MYRRTSYRGRGGYGRSGYYSRPYRRAGYSRPYGRGGFRPRGYVRRASVMVAEVAPSLGSVIPKALKRNNRRK